ncbi:hypothetical protein ABZ654_23715 [Streptomyces hygroscopicus]|uniref:hypothetical protein n=1 Tax=Streptomyces hygroscopicus TaxID=1912 RepID=UPI0033D28942
MPSVIGLLEQREARAQEELESWLEVLGQVQEEVAAAQERAERARVANAAGSASVDIAAAGPVNGLLQLPGGGLDQPPTGGP